MLDSNTYYSTRNPSLEITFGENFEYRKGVLGQYQHQFIDQENHRTAFIHVFLHEANQTQIDYYDNPENWIFQAPSGSTEIKRFATKMYGEKWYIQDLVYHPSTANCLLIRDLSAFTDTHDVFNLRYTWEIPPYKCEDWKGTASLGNEQKKFLEKFQEGFAEDIKIESYQETANGPKENTQTAGKDPYEKVVNSIAKIQRPEKTILIPTPVQSLSEKSVAIFPWLLKGEAGSFVTILSENIKYYINDSEELRLDKSYYKMKKIAKLNVPGANEFYNNDEPIVELIRDTSIEIGAQFALTGTMNIRCRWSDNCNVKDMRVYLLNVSTGQIETIRTSSWEEDARDTISSTIKEVFKQYIRQI
ncbi:hypothetical protein [Desulforhopalus sp. 52FAK]